MDRSHDLVGSWIIVDKVTGKPVIELYNAANVARVNTEKYQVYTACIVTGKQIGRAHV